MPKPNLTVTSYSSITESTARDFADKAMKLAEERTVTISVAVADAAGHLLHFRRMDGAPLISIQVAMEKARTAIWLQAPSSAFEQLVDGGNPSILSLPGAVAVSGGHPIAQDGDIVGALGISGSTAEIDREIAELAATL